MSFHQLNINNKRIATLSALLEANFLLAFIAAGAALDIFVSFEKAAGSEAD